MPKTNVLALSEEEKDGVIFSNWDPLVISTRIMESLVHCIMMDNWAFCNIIFKKTLDLLGDFKSYIESCKLGIKGFGNQSVQSYDLIHLAV